MINSRNISMNTQGALAEPPRYPQEYPFSGQVFQSPKSTQKNAKRSDTEEHNKSAKTTRNTRRESTVFTRKSNVSPPFGVLPVIVPIK